MTIPAPSGISSRRGLHRVVVDALGLRTVRGDLAAGQALPPEADLSEQLGVSRTVVREAIKVRAAKGLVESRPSVGARTLAVVQAIGRADPAGARESMEARIESTARGAGSVVEGRPAIGRNT
jgi:DNA-binding transcriptional MocR family regulator